MVYRKKLRVAVYYRVSKKSKNNIRMQRKVCQKYCLDSKMNLVKEYIDRGFSGRSKNRPALKRLLKDLDGGKIDCVLTYKVDRLGRNFFYLNELVKKFEDKGVRVVFATQNFDNCTPEGRFMFRILTILAEFESGMISARTIDGLRAAGRK